jgi:Family of unknown function (DUF6481)
MTAFREPGFKERQEAAAKAKQAALDKLRARQKPAEPTVVQQEATPVSRAKKQSAAKDAGATEKAKKQAAGKAAPKSAGKARKK